MIIIGTDDTHISSLTNVLQEFDNVALLFVSPSQTVTSAKTAIWRENRSRDFDDIIININDRTEICSLFPNIHNKLNGRHLIIHAKEYAAHVIKINPPNKSQPYYEGFTVEVVQLLSQFYNFTYTIVPEPEIADNMTWNDQLAIISDGKEVDFGIPLWNALPVSFLLQYTTIPLFYDTFTAMYVDNLDYDLGILDSYINRIFKSEVLLAFLFTFVTTFLLSILIDNSSQLINRNLDKNQITSFDTHSKLKPITDFLISPWVPRHENGIDFKHTKSIPDITKQGTQHGKRKSITSKPNYSRVSDMFFGIIGAICQQGSLPTTRRFSLRFLFWAWSLFILVITSVFKGSLTADTIRPEQSKRFSSFKDIANFARDICVPDEYISPIRIMNASTDGSLLKRIYQKSESFKARHPNICRYTKESLTIFDNGKHIVYFGTVSEMKANFPQHIGNVVIMQEPFLQAGWGFPLPIGSELRDLFSSYIQTLADQGITDFLYNYWNKNFYTKHVDVEIEQDRQLDDYIWLFSYCGIILAVSVFVLTVECFTAYILNKINLNKYTLQRRKKLMKMSQ